MLKPSRRRVLLTLSLILGGGAIAVASLYPRLQLQLPCVAVPVSDADMLATTILDLAADPARCVEMGRRARAVLDEKYSQRQAFERWLTLLEKVTAAGRPVRAGRQRP